MGDGTEKNEADAGTSANGTAEAVSVVDNALYEETKDEREGDAGVVVEAAEEAAAEAEAEPPVEAAAGTTEAAAPAKTDVAAALFDFDFPTGEVPAAKDAAVDTAAGVVVDAAAAAATPVGEADAAP